MERLQSARGTSLYAGRRDATGKLFTRYIGTEIPRYMGTYSTSRGRVVVHECNSCPGALKRILGKKTHIVEDQGAPFQGFCQYSTYLPTQLHARIVRSLAVEKVPRKLSRYYIMAAQVWKKATTTMDEHIPRHAGRLASISNIPYLHLIAVTASVIREGTSDEDNARSSPRQPFFLATDKTDR